MPIPKIIHYCFGMTPNDKPWGLLHHACVMSAIDKIKPTEVSFYYGHEPSSPWWDLTQIVVNKIKIDVPDNIFGRPLQSPAHRADIVRLIALIERGGIYLDTDVLVQKSFDDLLDKALVMGQEGPDGQFGLANSVMLAEPNSPFLKRWLEQYSWFRGGRDNKEAFWNEHSVQLPHFMSKLFPNDITVLDYKAFQWPLWIDNHIKWIFESEVSVDLSQTYANHLWQGSAWAHIEDLTPGKLRASRSNFAKWATPYVAGLPDDYGSAKTAVSKAPHHPRQHVFGEVYAKNQWGNDGKSAFFSGIGSRGPCADLYVKMILAELDHLRLRIGRPLRILDVGCGDFAVGSAISQNVPDHYIGCDIVPELISHNMEKFKSDRVDFMTIDAVEDDLPNADVCLVREVLQHLSNSDIMSILAKLRNYENVFVTEAQPIIAIGAVNPDKPTDSGIRFDWRTGQGRGVELDQAPFNLNIHKICEAKLATERVVTYQVQW